MLFRRRALFLAGLFVAVSCSDAGNPLDPDGPDVPAPGSDPEMVLQALSCEVNVRAGIMECEPLASSTGAALGAINLPTGASGTYVVLKSSNHVATATSETFDLTIKNNMVGQIIGTTNGSTPHAYGLKVYHYDPTKPTVVNPVVTDTTVPGLPASVTMNGDASQKFTGAGSKIRPYIQYSPQILLPGQTSAPEGWSFTLNNVDAYRLTLYVSAEVRWPKGWLNITPDAPIVQAGTNDTLTAQIRGAFGQRILEGVNWSSSNPAVVTVAELAPSDSLAQITGVSEGQAWVKAVSNHANAADRAARTDSVLVTVSPQIAADSISALSNVTVYLSADSLSDQTVVDTTYTTAEGGTATIASNGTLSYLSPAGYAGKDTVTYDVTNGVWRVKGRVIVHVNPSNYWYVQAGADDPVSTEDNTGRDAYPFRTMAAAITAAEANDSIFVLTPANGTDQVDGPAVLESGQAVLGAGISDLYQVVLNDTTVRIFAGTGAAPGLTRSTAGATVTATQNNIIRGVAVSASGGAAIFGSSFGTLYVRQASVASTGPALDLTTGTIDAELITLSSTNSTGNAIALNAGGRVSVLGSGSIAGAAAAAVSVSGSVKLFYGGSINQTSNTPLLNVANHSDSLSLTGTLTASNGSGLQFSNADGTYSFTGSATLNGGDAGVDVLAGSIGTFTFLASTSITNPTGPGLNVAASAPASLTYAGSIAANANRPVSIDGGCGTITVSGSISSTGQGILVQNCASGAVAFNGSKTLNTGANQAVTLASNSGATISFDSNLGITTTTGIGFGATGGGTVQVTGNNNTISTGTGTGLSLNGVSTGASLVTFRSVTTGAAPNGIALNNLTGIGVTVTGVSSTAGSGGTISGTTGHGVSLTNLGSLTTGVMLSYLNVSTGTAGVSSVFGTTFGTLTAAGNVLASTGGPALNLTTGALSANLASLSSSGSTTTGVSLTGVSGTLNTTAGTVAGGATGAFTVSGGTLGGTIASAVSQATAGQPVVAIVGAHNTGTLTFTGTVSATNGTGLQFTDADGTYAFTGTTTLAGGDAGIDIAAASAGTVNVAPSGGNTAAITSPSGVAIAVVGGSADLSYAGNVTQANNVSLLSVTGGHNGDIAFPSGTLSATNGNGLQFDNSDGTYDFDGTVTLAGGDAGIDITNGSVGTFTFPATATITSPNAGNLVSILNSAPNFTYSGAFTKANNNVTGILVSNNTGGTMTFNGSGVTKTISSGNAAAVNLASNTGATINFAGGSLAITSGTGAGLTATGGGTLQVTGASNTISSGSGTALTVQNTTIGASGLSFLSVAHSGGANGIFLSSTGTTNGLQVTGSGTNGSGGTITNTTGGDGATSGNGIYLNGTRNVSLNWMALSGHQNNGLYGTGVRGLTVNKVRFTGTNGTNNSGAFDESAVNLVDLGGAVKLTNSRFDGGAYNAVRVENISGTAPTLDSLVFENDTIESMQGSTADVRSTAMLVSLQDGTADTRIRSNRVTAWWGNAIHVLVQGTATGTSRITNNFVDNTNGALAGAGGIWVAGGNHTYNISGNTVRHTNGTAISADRVNFGTLMNGTINGNFVGVSGDANSGSATGIGIFASHHGPATTTVRISNNVIRQINGSANGAITTQTGDALAFGGSGTMNATITGNNIQESGTTVNNAQHGILVTHGMQSGPPTDTDQGCYDVLSNTIANFNSASVAASQNRIRLNQRFSTTTRWPGYTGVNTDGPALIAYLLGRNTAGNGSVANSSTGGFNNTSPAGSACPQPLL